MTAGLLEQTDIAERSGATDSPDPQQRNREFRFAHVKRFIERLLGDAGFRASLEEDAAIEAALNRHHLRIDPEDARAYLHALRSGDASQDTDTVRQYRAFVRERGSTDRLRELADASSNRRYAAWRRRQIGALRFRFSSASDLVVRPAAAYELSRGCSVGCWFCAVGAEKLQGHFLATADNLALFQATQQAARSVLGEAAGSAMCYWATDALDNPDYERFAHSFHREHGIFPPTTTAIGWKDPDRTRALLQTSASLGTTLNRFSVLSLGMLNRLHDAFTEEDLLTADMVFQMPEALVSIDATRSAPARKIRAGRARSLPLADARVYPDEAGTVACVVGFLFNFVELSIRLITPCVPSDRWPLGYRTLATAQGFSGATVQEQMEAMIDRHMPLGFGDEMLAVDEQIVLDPIDGGLHVHSPVHAVVVSAGRVPRETLRCLVSLVRSSTHTAAQVLAAMRREGMSLLQTQALLDRLHMEGVFEPS